VLKYFIKSKLIIICLINVTILSALGSANDSTKSLIFNIFDIEEDYLKKYEKGYLLDRIFRSREFKKPIYFIPIELRYGFAYNLGGGALGLGKLNDNWMTYEQDVEKFDGGNISSRINHHLDLDILKTNLAYYIFGNSWLDMHSGINFRYSSLLLPSKVPEGWSSINENWKSNSKFNSKIFELSWSQSLILQWFDSWYTNYRYTYGYAFSQLYKDQKKLSGFGPAQSFTIGARYIIDSDLNNNFTIGVDLKYTSSDIKNINDQSNFSPIKSYKVQNVGLYITASAFFGGEKSKGDIGKRYYFTRDYIAAKRLLEEFVDENPDHSNILRAKKLIIESERKIPYQLIRQGMSFDKGGKTNQAVEKYLLAKTLSDTLLKDVIDERLREIAFREVEKSEILLNNGFGDSAVSHISYVAGWYPEISHHVKRIKVGNIMDKGEKLYGIGLNNAALKYFYQALQIDPGLALEVGVFEQGIAYDLLSMADSLSNEESINFILYALEESKKLAGGLSKSNQSILDKLEKKISIKSDYETKKRIKDILLKDIAKEKSIKPIVLGMTISEVENIMGKPKEIISQSNSNENMLWIYSYDKKTTITLTFIDYKLFKIEE